MSAVGVAAAGDALRIGLEDNLLVPQGDYTQGIEPLIAEAVKPAAFFSRRPATLQEAREILRFDWAEPASVAA